MSDLLNKAEVKQVIDTAWKNAAKSKDADSIKMLRTHIEEIGRQLDALAAAQDADTAA